MIPRTFFEFTAPALVPVVSDVIVGPPPRSKKAEEESRRTIRPPWFEMRDADTLADGRSLLKILDELEAEARRGFGTYADLSTSVARVTLPDGKIYGASVCVLGGPKPLRLES